MTTNNNAERHARAVARGRKMLEWLEERGKSYNEVALMYGISRQRVQQLCGVARLTDDLAVLPPHTCDRDSAMGMMDATTHCRRCAAEG